MTRRFAALMVVACTALGVGVLAYGGPYRQMVRGALGDVIAVVWLAFLIQAMWIRWPWRRCLAITAAIAVGLEAMQGLGWVLVDAPRVVRVILGATYDPHDFIAYAVGLVIAWSVGVWAISRRGAVSVHDKNGEVFGGRADPR